jgi:hypothetical protein
VKRVSQQDQDLIRLALQAAVEGPYFADWEFGALMAVDRSDIAQILTDWPNATVTTPWESDPASVQAIAVDNVLNNLLGYPHGQWAELGPRLGADPDEVRAVLQRWRASTRTLPPHQ